MFSLIYSSVAVKQFSKEDLMELLKKSRHNNKSLNISGMLLYKNGIFLQALEGEKSKVQTLYDKISGDPRHKDANILEERTIQERDFPDWSMGFHDLDSPDVIKIPGYSRFLDSPLTEAHFSQDPSNAKKLLLLFKTELV